MVLPQLQELFDVIVPGLKVDGESSLSLTATLVAISCGVVEHSEHWYEAIRMSICTTNIAFGRPYVVNCEANSSSVFRDNGALFECIKNAFHGVGLHSQEEAGAHLRFWSTGIEKSGCRMSKPELAHQVVGFECRLEII